MFIHCCVRKKGKAIFSCKMFVRKGRATDLTIYLPQKSPFDRFICRNPDVLSALLPDGRTFWQITLKEPQKNLLAKSGRKGVRKKFIFSVFRGSFLDLEFDHILNYFLPKPLKNAIMTMQNFFFSNWLGNIGETWQHWLSWQYTFCYST